MEATILRQMWGIPASRSVWPEEAEGTGQGWERGTRWLGRWRPPGLPVIPEETESHRKLGPREGVLPNQVAGATCAGWKAGKRPRAGPWAEGTAATSGGSSGALAERNGNTGARQSLEGNKRAPLSLCELPLHTSISAFSLKCPSRGTWVAQPVERPTSLRSQCRSSRVQAPRQALCWQLGA